MALENLTFFGEVDKKNGKISSSYPAWYFDRLIENMEEEIGRHEREIKRGVISDEQKDKMHAKVVAMRKKYESIMESKPSKKGVDIDNLAKARKELGKVIAESMFTVSQERQRLVDPHEEVRRQKTPIISVKGDLFEICRAANCRISRDGKVSRDDAERAWKIAGRDLGEITNVSILKKQ